MPTIIIQADPSAGEPPRPTLTERIVAENLHDAHYATQLIERLRWAAADAEALTPAATVEAAHEVWLGEPTGQHLRPLPALS